MTNPSPADSDDFVALGFPWCDREFSFLSALLRAVRSVSGETAFALGGSFAAKSNGPLSDLDFFFYVARQDAYMQAELIRGDLASHPSVVTTCPLHHYHSFGYRCSWTLCGQPVSLVELFVSSSVDLKTTAMAKMNHLVIDKSPAYRSHLESSRSLADDSGSETVELILHDLVASAHKTRKEISAKSFLKAANRFYKFRMASLSILIFADTGSLHHPLVGEKYTGSLNPAVLCTIQQSYQLGSVADVAVHFKNIIELLQPGILAMCQSGRVSQQRATLIIEKLCDYALSR